MFKTKWSFTSVLINPDLTPNWVVKRQSMTQTTNINKTLLKIDNKNAFNGFENMLF